MAYEKQNWECGQVITADKLNHMEDGIAAGGSDRVIAHMTYSFDSTTGCETYTLDITGEQVSSIITNGQSLIIVDDDNYIYFPTMIYAKNVVPTRGPVSVVFARLEIVMPRGSTTVVHFSAGESTDYLIATTCDSEE